MASVTIVKKRTKPFKSVPAYARLLRLDIHTRVAQASPVRPLQECEGGMAETQGY